MNFINNNNISKKIDFENNNNKKFKYVLTEKNQIIHLHTKVL